MELTHTFTVPATPEQTWTTFMDLERVGGCFPGAQVTEVTDDGFTGTVKVKLGPIALQYAGSGRFVERDDANHHAVIEAKGKDKRGNGTAGATVTIALARDGEATRVDVTTDLQVTGKPAQFGRGVMQDVSDKLLGQFVACIESQFAPAQAADEPTTAVGSDELMAAAAVETAAGPPAAAPAPPVATRPAARPAPTNDDALDLGATVLPVLAKTYAPYAAVGLLALVIGWLLGRRR